MMLVRWAKRKKGGKNQYPGNFPKRKKNVEMIVSKLHVIESICFMVRNSSRNIQVFNKKYTIVI